MATLARLRAIAAQSQTVTTTSMESIFSDHARYGPALFSLICSLLLINSSHFFFSFFFFYFYWCEKVNSFQCNGLIGY